MRYQKVPDYRLKSLAVRRHRRGVHGRNQHAGVRDLRGVAAVAPGDAGAQATFILDKISASLKAVGSGMDDVVRTRIYLTRQADWEAVARAHGRVFGDIRPAATMVICQLAEPEMKIEIEVTALRRQP